MPRITAMLRTKFCVAKLVLPCSLTIHIFFGDKHWGPDNENGAAAGLGVRLFAGSIALAAFGGLQSAVAQDSSMILAAPQQAAPAKANKPAAAKPGASKPAASAQTASKPTNSTSPTAAAPTQPKPAIRTAAAAPAATAAAHTPTEAGVAVTGSAPASVPAAGGVAGKTYYIEFRSRSAQSYGHTFAMYGRLNGGRIASKTVVGLHPFTESAVPWMIGHLVLVPSETGPSDGDTEDQYVTARARVVMNEAEYRKVLGYINQLKAKSPVWHAVLYNCNAFVGDIAQFMGLETPTSTMLMPEEYIGGIRDLNVGRQSGEFHWNAGEGRERVSVARRCTEAAEVKAGAGLGLERVGSLGQLTARLFN